MATITQKVTLETIECCNCHMTFAVPDHFERKRRRDHDWFYCPAGHRQYFPGKSDLEKLEERLEAARTTATSHARRADRARERAERAERSRAAYKGQATKLKKRAAAGLCPCCNRSFQNLARHMKSKHPDFAEVSESASGEET